MSNLGVLRAYLGINIKFDLEYRSSVIASTLANITWTNSSLLAVLFLGNATGGIGGWTTTQMLLISGLWMLYNSLSHTLWYGNMRRTIDDIHSGKLDLILTKPIDSQLLTSFKRIITNSMFGSFEGIIVCSWAMHRLGLSLNLTQIGLAAVLVALGLVIYYSFWIMTATTGFYFPLVENITNVVPEMADFSKYPSSAFPGHLLQFAFALVPIMIITTVPAQILLGQFNINGVIWMTTAATALFMISRYFWNFSIRKYTSAN